MEIKSTDVRIGNIICWLHEDTYSISVVTAKIISQLSDYEADISDPMDLFPRGMWYAPLPLQPDNIEALGFVLHNGNYQLDIYAGSEKKGDKAVIEFDFNPERGEIQFKSRYEPGLYIRILPNLKYVHQLQNLYFSFMNKELPIIGLENGKWIKS